MTPQPPTTVLPVCYCDALRTSPTDHVRAHVHLNTEAVGEKGATPEGKSTTRCGNCGQANVSLTFGLRGDGWRWRCDYCHERGAAPE